jgi:hypothetical protein
MDEFSVGDRLLGVLQHGFRRVNSYHAIEVSLTDKLGADDALHQFWLSAFNHRWAFRIIMLIYKVPG